MTVRRRPAPADRRILPWHLPRSLHAAYADTVYEVRLRGRWHTVRIGRPAPLAARPGRDTCAAIITAWNPGSRVLSATENSRRHRRLLCQVRRAGLPCQSSRGLDPEGRWPAEPGLLIHGISCEAATNLARRFGQLALVWLAPGACARLVYTGHRAAPEI